MKKRSYIFIAIPVACIVVLVMSLITAKSVKIKKKKEENVFPVVQTSPLPPLLPEKNHKFLDDKEQVTQTIKGLYVPNYDETGKETFTMSGKNMYLLSNDIYKIVAPEIEILNAGTTEAETNSTQTVSITSDIGEMNKLSNEGYLSENVVVHLDQETRLDTDNLRYLPEQKIVYTDDFVTINRGGIRVTGQGCEIDLNDKKMMIKQDAEMIMDGVENDLFFLAKKSEDQVVSADQKLLHDTSEPEKVAEKTTIRSSGALIFDRTPGTNIMTFKDNVETKKGESSVFSDKLVVYLDSQTKKTKQAIASGNVLASQGTKLAKGNFLTWDVNTQSAILEDDRKAEFIDDKINIEAQKMIFYKEVGKIDVPSPGNLKVKLKQKNAKSDEDAIDEVINVKWDGKMNFLDDTREASFRENVEVVKENSILVCNYLDVTFNKDDYNLNTIKAKEKVHVIDKKDNLFSEAVGDRLSWNVKNKVTVIRGYPFALLREGNKRQIFAPRILFFDEGKNILCEGKGTLYETGKNMFQDKGYENNRLKVNWTKKMRYIDTLKKISFYEEVEVVQGGQKLYGDQIDAYLDDNKELSRLITMGNVFFISENLGNSEGLGSLLTWDIEENIAILTGEPHAELRKEGSRTFSKKVYFDMANDKITWEGRPHWQLISRESNGKREEEEK